MRAQPGFAVSRDGAEVLALDLALDDDLRRRGLAREVIRHVQDLRKETGLEVSDTIVLHVVGVDDLVSLFADIAREVLAVRIETSPPEGGGPGTIISLDDDGGTRQVTIWIERA